MAKRIKKSKTWTICYAISYPDLPDNEPFTMAWFAMGKTAEEAKESFLRQKAYEAEFCGGEPVEWFTVLNVIEGFSA